MNSVIVFCAQYLYLLIIIVLAIAWLKTPRDLKPRFIITVVLAGIIAFVLSRIASHLHYDTRPFVAEHVKPLFSHPPDNGFPSDHALLTSTLTAAAYFFNRKLAYVMIVLTFIVGLSRVLAKVHSPEDILGGWAFGIIGALASYYLLKRLWQKKLKGQA